MLCAAGPLWITASSPWVARLRRRGGSRPWLLFEWDDHNNIHELPPGTDPGGRVGVGNMLARRAGPCAERHSALNPVINDFTHFGNFGGV